MMQPKSGQIVWRWSGEARQPVPIMFVGRNGSWQRWKRGDAEWNERGGALWYDNAVNCAWAEFEARVCNAGFRLKHFNTTRERETERAYEAACCYVRCFCDQFEASPQTAWASPNATTTLPPVDG